MSFGRLSDIIESIEKELHSMIYTSEDNKSIIYLDQEIVNQQMISIHNNQKNLFP